MKKANIFYENLLSSGSAQGICIFPASEDTDYDAAEFIYRMNSIMPEQTHSLNVGIAEYPWQRFPDTDALVTFKTDLPVGVRTADCVPVLVYAPDVEGVSAIHAGWKGTLGGIVDNALDVLIANGASPSEMIVAFGPSISKEKYEVDNDLASRFIEAGFGDYVSRPDGENGKPHIDLQGINLCRLLKRGVKRENITLHDGCTYSSVYAEGGYKYQSYRRDKDGAGRNLTTISLLDPAVMEHYNRLFSEAYRTIDDKEPNDDAADKE